jgi:hypothetical protein
MENRIGAGISMGSAAAAAAAGAGGDGGGTPLMDDFDREEEEHAREDLAAIAQDIPRSRGELLKCGTQLTGILLDVIMEVRGHRDRQTYGAMAGGVRRAGLTDRPAGAHGECGRSRMQRIPRAFNSHCMTSSSCLARSTRLHPSACRMITCACR